MAIQHSKGFSTIAILVILLVIAGAGASGWYVWNKNKKTDTTNTNTTAQTNSGDDQNNDTVKPSDPSEGGKYLVIEEMKVRVPLSEDLKGDVLTHVTTDGSNVDAYFASKRLNSLVGDNTCGFVTQPSGSISPALEVSLHRIDPDVEFKKISKALYLSSHTLLKKTANYEYYANKDTKPEISCLTNTQYDGQYNDVLDKVVASLNKSINDIEVIN
jgi:hypothetical protein